MEHTPGRFSVSFEFNAIKKSGYNKVTGLALNHFRQVGQNKRKTLEKI